MSGLGDSFDLLGSKDNNLDFNINSGHFSNETIINNPQEVVIQNISLGDVLVLSVDDNVILVDSNL